MNKPLMVAIIATIILTLGIFYLGYEFKQIDMDGITCLNDPLEYAEYIMENRDNIGYICQCTESKFNVNLSQITES